MSALRPLLLVLALTLPAAGQCQITTTYGSNNSLFGNMFEIVAIQDVTIQSFDVNLDGTAGPYDIEVYTSSQPYAVVQTTPTAWTLVGSVTGLASAGTDVPTPLNLALNVPIAAGTQASFYVTISNAVGAMLYTNGTGAGLVFAQDQNLQILEGDGMAYPFLNPFSPRVFNGTVHYGLTTTWQQNSPEASFDADGVQSGPCESPARDVCIGVPGTFNIQSTSTGLGWEMLISALPGSATGIPLPGGQRLHIDFSGPVLYLNGLAAPNALPFPGNLSVPYTLQAPGTTTGQTFHLAPTAPAGFALSQCVEVNAVPQVTSIAGPAGNDESVVVEISAAPQCWAPGGLPAFGTTFDRISVESNGRVILGGNGDADGTASPFDAVADDPFIGFWADLDPGPGSIGITSPALGVINVDYLGVLFAGEPGSAVSFTITLDANSGDLTLSSLGSIVPNPNTQGALSTADSQFLGLSGGALVGATDPGALTFASGTTGSAAQPTDMLYDWSFGIFNSSGLVSSLLAGGVSQIVFSPIAGSVGYTYTVL